MIIFAVEIFQNSQTGIGYGKDKEIFHSQNFQKNQFIFCLISISQTLTKVFNEKFKPGYTHAAKNEHFTAISFLIINFAKHNVPVWT